MVVTREKSVLPRGARLATQSPIRGPGLELVAIVGVLGKECQARFRYLCAYVWPGAVRKSSVYIIIVNMY